MALKRLFRRSHPTAEPERGDESYSRDADLQEFVDTPDEPEVTDDPDIGEDDTVEIFKGDNGKFYWHRIAPNGKIVSGNNEPDGFENYGYAKKSAVEYSGVPSDRISYRMEEK